VVAFVGVFVLLERVSGPARLTVDEVLVQLEREIGFADLSDGVERYYADLYAPVFRGDEVELRALVSGAHVFVVSRGEGFGDPDEAWLAEEARAIAGTAPSGVVIHRGVAAVVLFGPADQVRDVLD
jgi:hypothetical protein